jgi:hypothetical protein
VSLPPPQLNNLQEEAIKLLETLPEDEKIKVLDYINSLISDEQNDSNRN